MKDENEEILGSEEVQEEVSGEDVAEAVDAESVDDTLSPDVSEQPHARATFNDSIKYHLTGMYQDWFLDYASYVILERAVPDIYDGLKPVQRRILHAMKTVDDGRFNKVANIVGQTMQYHPHGDASIGDALVQLGQKDLLIDCQGNWGNILTGDGAAAPRYIEARLSKFALETVFNPKTTHWMLSYDGRKKEPINLPVKFPLLLAQGVEGIAVGLNSKILPHNFNELCDASLAYLRGEEFQLFPDFPTGGSIDVSRYNDGERGGMVKVRSKITKSADNKTLIITEIPFGTTSTSIIETILRANQKGKIKIRKVDDNTAAEAEIVVQLQPGSSSDKTIDALYAFTDCEVSISPNCCVIQDKKPIFTNVSNLLRMSTDHTRDLLRWELEIQKNELEEQYFYVSLEKIFIEKRIYKEKEFEDSTSPEKAIAFIRKAIEPYVQKLIRPVTDEDLRKLLEIKMMRITKFDSKKANDQLKALDEKIKEVKYNLSHLTDYTITWFENLKQKYGDRYPRHTEVRNFASINVKTVVEANQKMYINSAEGFIGTSLKKDTYLFDCSDLDDIIIFYRDGKYKIIKVQEKAFVGPNILHIAVFKKNDERTIYNVVYREGKSGPYYMKRFAATGLARDKEYDLTTGKPGSRVIYFTANPNGEAEVIRVQLDPALKLKHMEVLKDLSELAVKGRASRGNLLTKFKVKSITLKQKGGSTLGGRKVWFDPDVLRLNYDGMGQYLGEFQSEDKILVIAQNGDYFTTSFELTAHFENNIYKIEKYDPEKVWSLVLWDADQGYWYAKRFLMNAGIKPQNFIGDNPQSRMLLLNDRGDDAIFLIHFEDEAREDLTVAMRDFIAVKGATARGKRLTNHAIASIEDITPIPEPEPEPEPESEPEAEPEVDIPAEPEPEPEPSEPSERPEPPKRPKRSKRPAQPEPSPLGGESERGADDIPMTINADIPEDSLPVEEKDDQLSLF